jgi:site-specific DNA recombinase
MGRLTLNVLLSFAQFEREVTSERIRDKIAASKRKGLWVGGMAPLGYDTKELCFPHGLAVRANVSFALVASQISLSTKMQSCSIGAIDADQSTARDGNPYHVVGWNRLGGGRGPGRGGAKFFHRYV